MSESGTRPTPRPLPLPIRNLRGRLRPRNRPRFKGLSFNRMIPNILTMLGLCAGLTAMRYALTGAEFGATDALRMNVVAQVCPLADAERAGIALATAIGSKAPLAVQAALAQAQTWADRGEAAALSHSVPDIIRLLSSRDAKEAMRAAAEGRAPAFSGE